MPRVARRLVPRVRLCVVQGQAPGAGLVQRAQVEGGVRVAGGGARLEPRARRREVRRAVSRGPAVVVQHADAVVRGGDV